MNHAPLITGHDHFQPKAIDAPLEFINDPNMVGKVRVGLAVMVAKRDAITPGKSDEPHGVINASDLGIDFRDLEVLL
ncbi:MAG: hypothetical protein AAGC76_09615 [Luteibacter sp.]|uniref:hypothetical protein n=1 Tax=Luteibacter sp. TaxID=1886636 RepID=UPI0028084868|nr:hypothetical protein [Luteibacter sp.]MDQ7996098.1 hypothetical protein [Luteibacter sp.]